MSKQFSRHPSNATGALGQPAVLSCAIDSRPPANVSWTKDGRRLAQGDRYHAIGNKLLIVEVTEQDAGAYRCIASNVYLNRTRVSQAGWLAVAADSQNGNYTLLDLQERDITVKKGGRVTLYCPVYGLPQLKMKWTLAHADGGLQDLEVSGQILDLPKVDIDQEGLYTCTVDTREDLTKSFNVSVWEDAHIVVAPSNREAPRASTVRFACSAGGRPAPATAWYKDGEPLALTGRIKMLKSAVGDRKELVISSVTSDDAGVYQCMARSGASVASAWATLRVSGARGAGPRSPRCAPAGPRAVAVSWRPPRADTVVAYTVHVTPQGKPGTSLPGQPHTHTEEIVTVEEALTPYRFQVRAYIRPTANDRNVASDLSESVVCQGQGVPVKVTKSEEGDVTVSWRDFALANPGVVQWILQHRVENSTQEHNVTLPPEQTNYTMKGDQSFEVRVLGSRSEQWLKQDLTLVPWTSTSHADADTDPGAIPLAPTELEAVGVRAGGFALRWRAEPRPLTFMVCVRRVGGNDECHESDKRSTEVEGLEGGAEYEVRVQAREPGRALGGAFSRPLVVATLPSGAHRFKDLTYEYVNASAVRVSWAGGGVAEGIGEGAGEGRYTVRYSARLQLPVELWPSVRAHGNSAIITGIEPTDHTYIMVTGYEPLGHSQVLKIPPQQDTLEAQRLEYSYVRGGVRVRWAGGGARAVRYSQNLTRPLDAWTLINVTDDHVDLWGLDESRPTYVVVSAGGNQVLTVPPAPVEHNPLYLVALGVCGACALAAMVVAAVCCWRTNKQLSSPLRSRRRHMDANESNVEDVSEMKDVGGRLANGGGAARGAGEPLLNGHVRITENPTQTKTPNGRLKRSSPAREAAFDLSRHDDLDLTVDTFIDMNSTAGTLQGRFDTTMPSHYDTGQRHHDTRPSDHDTRPMQHDTRPSNHDMRSSHHDTRPSHFGTPPGRDAPRGLSKLPDGNMNLELRTVDFQKDNAHFQPTLQPNG